LARIARPRGRLLLREQFGGDHQRCALSRREIGGEAGEDHAFAAEPLLAEVDGDAREEFRKALGRRVEPGR
jgi:hypothetical protein